MTMNALNVTVQFERVVCRDENDGPGSAEPYLWPVFFKIDGETVRLNESLKLSGSAVVVATRGAHNNLGNHDVDDGEVMTISANVGAWSTVLRPIPSALPLPNEFGGVLGCVAVLMEEDNVSDSGAIAGYQALVAGVQKGLNDLIGTFGITKQDITQEDVEKLKAAVFQRVKSAITSTQNIFKNIWSAVNPDDQIGTGIWYYSHATLAAQPTTNLYQRFRNEGDWEIFGRVSTALYSP